nr:hypothetical protein [uncultured Cellulosilyticum sp.]
MAVRADFFQKMEVAVSQGLYKKYEEVDEQGIISICMQKYGKKSRRGNCKELL